MVDPALVLLAAPAMIAGALMVALGVLILAVNSRAAANRAFVAFLVMFGLAVGLGGASRASSAPDAALAWRYTAVYPVIAVWATLLWFMSVYPRRRGLARMRGGLPALLVVALAVEAAFLIDHDLMGRFEFVAGQVLLVESGPLSAHPQTAMMGVAALVFALDARRERAPSRFIALALTSAAFGLVVLFNAVQALAGTSLLLAIDDNVWARLDATLVQLAALPAVAGLGTVAMAARRADDAVARRVAALVLVGAALAALSAFVVARGDSVAARVAVTGAWRLVIPAFVAYALLKHQMLDLDLKIKWTVKQSTIAAAFIAVFFVVSESASAFFAGRVGTYIGIAAAGLLVFALAPLQRFAERVADRAMPGVAPSADYLTYRKFEIYKVAVEGALKDGAVTPDERETLDRLREKLELSAEAAEAIERDLRPKPVAA